MKPNWLRLLIILHLRVAHALPAITSAAAAFLVTRLSLFFPCDYSTHGSY